MLQTVPGVKVVRVYGRTIEDQTFKQSLRTNLSSAQSVMDRACEEIALHFRIRNQSNPHSSRVKLIEDEVMQLRKRTVTNGSVKDHERNRKELCLKVQEFHRALDEAEGYEIAESGTEVVLCTCIEAGSSRVKRHARVSHVIIDEASMCLEAESLVALSTAGQRLQQVVLLGDHKQLGAVIMSSAPRKLGLSKSLFEELFHDASADKTYTSCMLQTQYRMVSVFHHQESLIMLRFFNCLECILYANLKAPRLCVLEQPIAQGKRKSVTSQVGILPLSGGVGWGSRGRSGGCVVLEGMEEGAEGEVKGERKWKKRGSGGKNG